MKIETVSESKVGFVYEVEVLRRPWWMPKRFAKRRCMKRFFRCVDYERLDNLQPIEGLNHMLSVEFAAGTQVTTWYTGIFEGNYTPLTTSVMSTFPSLATECTAYDESTRPAWVEAAPASGLVTNSASRAEFTMNATKTLYGTFISSSSVKSGTSGVLASAGKFSAAKSVDSGDILRVTHGIQLTST